MHHFKVAFNMLTELYNPHYCSPKKEALCLLAVVPSFSALACAHLQPTVSVGLSVLDVSVRPSCPCSLSPYSLHPPRPCACPSLGLLQCSLHPLSDFHLPLPSLWPFLPPRQAPRSLPTHCGWCLLPKRPVWPLFLLGAWPPGVLVHHTSHAPWGLVSPQGGPSYQPGWPLRPPKDPAPVCVCGPLRTVLPLLWAWTPSAVPAAACPHSAPRLYRVAPPSLPRSDSQTLPGLLGAGHTPPPSTWAPASPRPQGLLGSSDSWGWGP